MNTPASLARSRLHPYHIRTGDHDITPYDWGRYLDFADRHLRKRRVLYNFDGDSCLSTKAGADGTYLFNFFTSREEGEQAYEPPFAVLRDLEPAGGRP